jgi:DNA-binding NarL/FixJ family response regulator
MDLATRTGHADIGLETAHRQHRGTGALFAGRNPFVSEMRVLIVDDEDDMRALVRATIEVANEGLSVAGEASDGEAALTFVNEERPEVVVMDQRMPGLSGLDTARRILSEHPDQAIVLFSSYLDRDVVNTARNLGVRVCLPKDEIRQLPDVLWSTELNS